MRRKEHLNVGFLTGMICSVAYLLNQPKEKKGLELIDFRNILIIMGGSTFGSLLPDVIEPATNPNHRSIFHSVLFGSILTGNLIHNRNAKPDYILKMAINSISAGYISHLVTDSTTPMGLPIVK